MKKERPILFSTPMVQALLEGRKTQTRRIIKPQPSPRATEFYHSVKGGWPKTPWHARLELPSDPGYYEVTDLYKCPYGTVGDILWVRETFIQGQKMDGEEMFVYDDNGHPIDKTWYRADGDLDKWFNGDAMVEVPWKPSIHMPKSAARLWLELTDIRVERVQDISEEDAIAEGVESRLEERLISKPVHYKVYYNGPGDDSTYSSSASVSFETLWQKINGPESLQANPWIWALTLKVLSTTGKTETL